MANALYDKGREGFLDGSIDYDTDDIRAILVDAGQYTVDLSSHQFLSSVPVGARVGVTGAFANKTKTNGIADADDIDFTVGASQPTAECIVIYKHTGNDATARLIAYVDTVSSGLPYTPPTGGGLVQVRWDNGANKIFKL